MMAPLNFKPNDFSEIPYTVYSDEEIYQHEQKHLFQGKAWHFLGLDIELPNPGDYKTMPVGDISVIVVRDTNGTLNAMVNRCAHRGNLVCVEDHGNLDCLTCVYHNWTYDLRGKLTGVAFGRGVRGQGGLTEEFKHDEHGLERIRIENVHGFIMGTFSDETPPFASYIGTELMASIERVFIKPLKVLGYHSQIFPNNWKLYVENNKDSYHASLLHVFHNTFGVVRPTMTGGIKLSESGWHHLSYTQREEIGDDNIDKEKVRAKQNDYSLEDTRMMEHVLELGDKVTNSIQTVFPTMVLQQILNALAVRQLIPKGVNESELIWTILGFEDDDSDMDELRMQVNNLVGPAGFISMEDGCVGGFIQTAAKANVDAQTILPMGGRKIEPSQGSRVTESAVRGFWKGWRECMGV